MTSTPKSASGAPARHAAEPGKPQEAAGPFVLNLCSSTTPMALSNPEQAELKRFSFFVSRRFEEGRERFRLHMGYFQTLAEAEEWLGAVRDIYPGAWAGEAPGKKLRERAVAAAAAQAQHAAGPPPLTAPAAAKPVAVSAPPRNVPTIPVAQAASPDVPPLNVPTIHAAAPVSAAPRNIPVARPTAPVSQPVVAARAPATGPSVIGMMRPPKAAAPAPVATNAGPTAPKLGVPKSSPVMPTNAPTAPLQARSPTAVALMTQSSAAAVRPSAPAPSRSMAASPAPATRSAQQPAARSTQTAARSTQPTAPARAVQSAKPAATAANGHQQAAVAQASRTQGAPAAVARPNPKASGRPALPNSNVREVLKALDEAPTESETTGETRMMPAPVLAGLHAASDDNNFTDTQVLKFLETRRADGTELTGIDVETGAISLLKPDDTGTRRALKEAVTENAPVWFAVQLQWSVQPVELSNVPPLAIFSAYTLYTVEGSRDGRKWFGLRLGFFSDAISAKQVAYYVRSEFTSVAVVPVSPQERTRASDTDKKTNIAFPKKTRSEPVDEFKLLDADVANQDSPRPRPVATKPAGPANNAPPAVAATRRAPKANTGRVRAREARTPQTLEETLEILGAGQLEMDNGNGETMNESGVRHLRVEVQKNTPFGRLLERLSERVRKP